MATTESDTIRRTRSRHRAFLAFMSMASVFAFITAISLLTRSGVHIQTTHWQFDHLYVLTITLTLASLVVAALIRIPAPWSGASGRIGTLLWILILAGGILFAYRYPFRVFITKASHLAQSNEPGLLEEQYLVLGIHKPSWRFMGSYYAERSNNHRQNNQHLSGLWGSNHTYRRTRVFTTGFKPNPALECLSAKRFWFAGVQYVHTWHVNTTILKDNMGNADCHKLDKSALLTGPYKGGKKTRTVPGFLPRKEHKKSEDS